MFRRAIILGALCMQVFFTACAVGEMETLGEGITGITTQELTSGEIQLQQEGIGPIEITPPPPGEAPGLPPASAGGSGNISSSGERSESNAPSDQPGMIQSKAPGGQVLEQALPVGASWLIYQDQSFPFSLAYPDTYAILENDTLAEKTGLNPIHQVRFLDKQLAEGDTADLEIPNFTVEIYNLDEQSLESFLDKNFPQGQREQVTLNNVNGLRVFFNNLIAPNQFYYLSDRGYVYRLIPMGEFSQEMLASFQIR